MSTALLASDLRPVLTLELDLGSGPRAASARLELWAGAGSRPCEAHVALRGWIGRVAEQRLVRTLGTWLQPGVERVVLDCRDARRLDPHTAQRLVGIASRRDGACPVEIRGLPRAVARRPAGAAGELLPSGTHGECGA